MKKNLYCHFIGCFRLGYLDIPTVVSLIGYCDPYKGVAFASYPWNAHAEGYINNFVMKRRFTMQPNIKM